MPDALHSVTHILYDMDGLLLDTEPFYTEVTQAIVGRYGHTFEWSLKSQMIGKRAADSARILVATESDGSIFRKVICRGRFISTFLLSWLGHFLYFQNTVSFSKGIGHETGCHRIVGPAAIDDEAIFVGARI